MYYYGEPHYYANPYYQVNPYQPAEMYDPNLQNYFDAPLDYNMRQVDLGTRWEVEEGGYRGVWTRRGNSNVFDGRWTRQGATPITAVLRMTSVHRP